MRKIYLTLAVVGLLLITANFTKAEKLNKFKIYTNESFDKQISTKYFNVFYNHKAWQIGNWFALKVDDWAEVVFEARGFKPGVKIDVYIVHNTTKQNAFSNYDKIYMYLNRVIDFTQPNQNEWMEDVFKHELGHNLVSLGGFNRFLIYSGIDNFFKNIIVDKNNGTVQEGSSVLLESMYGQNEKSGRLNSATYLGKMLYNIDGGYKIDFWKSEDFNAYGDRYLEGSHFYKFIVDQFGADTWRDLFNIYLNSYWNMVAYRFEDFIAKELGYTSTADLIKLYDSYLQEKSVSSNPGKVVEGTILAGQTKNVRDLLDIIDGKLYFAVRDDLMTEIVTIPLVKSTLGLYQQTVELKYARDEEISDNIFVQYIAKTTSKIKTHSANYYYRLAFNKSLLGSGSESYYIQAKDNNALFSKTIVNNSKNTEHMVAVKDRMFFVVKEFDKFKLYDPINNEIILDYNASYIIDRPRYSADLDSIYFAANKIGESEAYVFIYNLNNKSLKRVVKGMKPYIDKMDLFFVNLSGNDKVLNAFKLNLSTNVVIKITNLKYGLDRVMAKDGTLYYTAYNNTDRKGQHTTGERTIYSIGQERWLNEGVTDLVADNRSFSLTQTNSYIPTDTDVDKGRNAYAFMPVLQPYNLFYSLDGNFLLGFRNQKDSLIANIGLVTDNANRTVIENPTNWQDENGEYRKAFKDVLEDQFIFDKKDYYFRVIYGPGQGSSGSLHEGYYNFLSFTAQYSPQKRYLERDGRYLAGFGAPSPYVAIFNYNTKRRDTLATSIVFGPRIWDYGYGVIPTVDLLSLYSYSKHDTLTSLKVENASLSNLIGTTTTNKQVNVTDAVLLGLRIEWADYKTILNLEADMQNRYRSFNFGTVRGTYVSGDNDFIQRIEDTGSYNENYSVGLEFGDILRAISLPKFIPLETDDYNFDIEYTAGDKLLWINPANTQSFMLSKYRLYNNAMLNPYADTGNFDIPIGYEGGDGYINAIPRRYLVDPKTQVLQIGFSKLYDLYPYFGNKNFGISNVKLVPFVANVYVWGDYTYNTDDHSALTQFSSTNLYYGLAGSFILATWRLEPKISFSIFSKEATKKAAKHYSGLNLVPANLDQEYKGVLINASIRF